MKKSFFLSLISAGLIFFATALQAITLSPDQQSTIAGGDSDAISALASELLKAEAEGLSADELTAQMEEIAGKVMDAILGSSGTGDSAEAAARGILSAAINAASAAGASIGEVVQQAGSGAVFAAGLHAQNRGESANFFVYSTTKGAAVGTVQGASQISVNSPRLSSQLSNGISLGLTRLARASRVSSDRWVSAARKGLTEGFATPPSPDPGETMRPSDVTTNEDSSLIVVSPETPAPI